MSDVHAATGAAGRRPTAASPAGPERRRRARPQEQLVRLAILAGRHRRRRASAGAWSAIAVILALRRHDLPARARPLPHRPSGRHEGHRVLPRLRAPHLVVPPGRDRVRLQGHPRRRLRAHHRDEQPRGGRPRRRGPHLPARRRTGAGCRWPWPARPCTSCSPSCCCSSPSSASACRRADTWYGGQRRARDSPAEAGRARARRPHREPSTAQPVATFDELTSIIRRQPGEEVTLAVERDGEELDQGRHPRRAPARLGRAPSASSASARPTPTRRSAR